MAASLVVVFMLISLECGQPLSGRFKSGAIKSQFLSACNSRGGIVAAQDNCKRLWH
jgi:hypothetical protein